MIRSCLALCLLMSGCNAGDEQGAEAQPAVESPANRPGPRALSPEEAERARREQAGRSTLASIDPDLPDPYEAPAIGVSLKKPEQWVYLDETSHPQPGRWQERQRFPELREIITDISTPLVSMAPVDDPVPGVTPIVSVVFRFALEPPFVQRKYQDHPETVAGNYTLRFKRLPDHAVVEPTELTLVGGQPGAVTRVRYSLVDPDTGAKTPVTMRIWNTKRDMAYIYIESLMPDPAPAEAEARVEEIVSSIRLDPPRMPPFEEHINASLEGIELW